MQGVHCSDVTFVQWKQAGMGVVACTLKKKHLDNDRPIPAEHHGPTSNSRVSVKTNKQTKI